MAIQAGPQATVAFSTVTTVNVALTDINDMAPRFPARDVVLDVSEGAKVCTLEEIDG